MVTLDRLPLGSRSGRTSHAAPVGDGPGVHGRSGIRQPSPESQRWPGPAHPGARLWVPRVCYVSNHTYIRDIGGNKRVVATRNDTKVAPRDIGATRDIVLEGDLREHIAALRPDNSTLAHKFPDDVLDALAGLPGLLGDGRGKDRTARLLDDSVHLEAFEGCCGQRFGRQTP